jgi:hypothetical protein
MPKLGQWLNELWDHVATLQPMSSYNVRVRRTTRGFSMEGVSKSEEPEGQHRGEWDASFGTSYATMDQVKISNGQEAGNYLATEAIAANDSTKAPWTGNGWILIGRINDQSNWL